MSSRSSFQVKEKIRRLLFLERIAEAYRKGVHAVAGEGVVVGHVKSDTGQLSSCTEGQGIRPLVGMAVANACRDHLPVSVFQTGAE